MKRIYLTGYRSFELAIFQETDPKITIIKNMLKKELTNLLENGLEWLLLSGNLGVEQWAFEVAKELKEIYPDFKVGLFLPFEGFGEQWNEKNKNSLNTMINQCDYVNTVSHKPYESPQQLKNHTHFLLQQTMGALLIYDDEFPGKTSYFLQDAKKYSETEQYLIMQVTMDDLQHSQD